MSLYLKYGAKASYDNSGNEEYKKCPFCGSLFRSGGSGSGSWYKKYDCGTRVDAKYGNEDYVVKFDLKCESEEGVYNGSNNGSGRAIVPMRYHHK